MGEFTDGILPYRFPVAGIVSNYFVSIVSLSCQLKRTAHNNSNRKRFHVAEGRKPGLRKELATLLVKISH